MGRQAILAALCWLAISQAFGDKRVVTQSATVKDNESAASGPRLYRNVPLGVYAGAAPYASYSFQLPQFIAAPKAATSQVTAVKAPINQVNTYLMDSYGNRYFEGPQQAPYKAAFPQQFVSLQPKLPEHLAQPLVAASPNFQFKQSGPQVFFGAPLRVPALQGSAPTPLNSFPSFGQLVYAQNVQSLASPANGKKFGFSAPTAQQQSTNNKAVFANTQPHEQYSNIKNEPKFQRQQELPQIIVGKPKFKNSHEISSVPHGEVRFQRIQEKPHEPHNEVKTQRIQEIPHGPHGALKFQRLQEAPQIVHVEHSYDGEQASSKDHGQSPHDGSNDKGQLKSTPKETTITYVNNINGKQSIVKVKSEPLPLLDLTLLEPLTFANPLVPQVQHFLPRINQATYQKLPQANIDTKNYQKEYVVQKTMSYDSREANDKPQKNTYKKKEKKPTHSTKQSKKNDAPKKTTGLLHETLDQAPEIVYEINVPGRKETIKQKAISYNKQTQSEPVQYSYNSKSEKEPVTYSYARSSKDPVQSQEVHYHGNGQGPTHLIYNLKPEEQYKEEPVNINTPHSHSESHTSQEDETPQYNHNYKEHPKSFEVHHESAHKEQDHEDTSQENHDESPDDPSKYYSAQSQQAPHENFDPITKEYEEDIRLLASAQIKVDPSQHLHPAKLRESAQAPQRVAHSDEPHPYHHSSPQKHAHHSSPQQSHPHYPHSESPNSPPIHVHEKSKRIIIHDESPDERHMHQEQMKEEVIDREENNEEDFEKAYKNAAYGFPGYTKEALDADEKNIFDPESYGVPPDDAEYTIDPAPFQQYQLEGDEFPKESRGRYKDARDKMKENYYTGYSISKPDSLLDRYQNKLDYYKLYKEQKPEYYVPRDDDEKKKHQPQFAKYSVAPKFEYPTKKEEKGNSYYGYHKPKEQLYEYDYSKGTPRDSSAFASRPAYRFKSKFVEPQFQYGFEPISLPKLLDSELAAVASNHSPESEKPGMRKKVYKENWYIKKTRTAGGAPAS